MRFAGFAALDWSGAAGPRQRGIAVATCRPGDAAPSLVRPGHIWSRGEALTWIEETAASGSWLIGLDLSPALPFQDRGAYFPGWPESPPDARTLWRLVDEVCAGEPNLGVSHFPDHPEFSRHYRRHGGRLGDLFGTGRGRLRVVEHATLKSRALPNPYSSFNLVGAAQVGKASLSGMRLYRLLDGRVPLWPFDPEPQAGPVVVEIYTSIAALSAGVERGRSKLRDATSLDRALAALGSRPHAPLAAYDDHATDALVSAAWLRRVADDRRLWSPALLTDELSRTEGWTFGVP